MYFFFRGKRDVDTLAAEEIGQTCQNFIAYYYYTLYIQYTVFACAFINGVLKIRGNVLPQLVYTELRVQRSESTWNKIVHDRYLRSVCRNTKLCYRSSVLRMS